MIVITFVPFFVYQNVQNERGARGGLISGRTRKNKKIKKKKSIKQKGKKRGAAPAPDIQGNKTKEKRKRKAFLHLRAITPQPSTSFAIHPTPYSAPKSPYPSHSVLNAFAGSYFHTYIH